MNIQQEKQTSDSIKKEKVYADLERVSHVLPTAFYWTDINHIIVGVNKNSLDALGVSSYEEVIGKTAYDFYPKEIADKLLENQKIVTQTGKTITVEETMQVVSTHEIRYFVTTIAPLYGKKDNIIGTIGSAIDITQEKRKAESSRKIKVLEHLQKVSQILPTPFYWLDLSQKYLGINKLGLIVTGTESYEKNFANKTPLDIYPKKMAKEIMAHHQQVIKTGKTLFIEEMIKDISTQKIKYFNATISPLHDDNTNIIGTIGTSIEITAEKEALQLKLDSEKQKAQLEEQEKFSKIAKQVAHDIRSPLASILMVIKAREEIPEIERIALREAAIRIEDIANHLLNQYRATQHREPIKNEQREAILISPILSQLLTEKKYEYRKTSIKWDYTVNVAAHFSFIHVESSAFKRMISNLINNAIDALPHQTGHIRVGLDANPEWVKISIEDNGKGMSAEVMEKIKNQISVTEGKDKGHGLGLTQARETLQRNQGEMSINSILGKGTCITLTFPRIPASSWIAENITLQPSDTIIVLDDDPSIHGAWDTHFESILKKRSDIHLKHFTSGEETVKFMNQLSEEEKKKILLLSDYELLKQPLNGLDVIQQSQISRSILVTSHFADIEIRNRAEALEVKVLPKWLASEISIIFNATVNIKKDKVDIIIVDDNKKFTEQLALFIFKGAVVDQYHQPEKFLEHVYQYHKDTKIYLDNNFDNSSMKGLDIAKQLYEQGYNCLYLLSGEHFGFEPDSLPNYLTLIKKTDINAIKASYKVS